MALQKFMKCLVVLFVIYDVAELDVPCDSAKTLGHLTQRQIGYELGDDEAPLSDYRLQSGWYSLPENITLATNSTQCGSYFTWWLRDPLPSKKSSNLVICQNDGTNDCAENKTIQVRSCSFGYAYRLDPTDSDLEAYCIESTESGGPKTDDAPDLSNLILTVSAGIHTEESSNTLEFYCDINSTDESYRELIYDVEWSLHSGVSQLSSIHYVEGIAYDTAQTFRDDTKLTEKHLTDNRVKKPGFTIICSLAARKSILGHTSKAQYSLPKFCGVKMLTPSLLRVNDDEEIDIQLQLTIPFGCYNGGICSLEFEMLVPQNTTETCVSSGPSIIDKFAGRNCGIKFSREGENATFKVSTTFGSSIRESEGRVYELTFLTPTKFKHHPFFRNYELPPIRIEVLVDQTLLQNKECYAVSDPHMRTFNGNLYENQNEGTYIMYRHKELEAEVQIKTTLCNLNRLTPPPYCVCGVAVRAGKDIFAVDNCENDRVLPPAIVQCDDRVLYRQIKKKPTGYEIMLPHGTKVYMAYLRNFWNVHIYPSLVDKTKTEGLCGIFNVAEDKIPRTDGSMFIKSWSVPEMEDLFMSANYGNMNSWSEELIFCDCFHWNSTASNLFGYTRCSSQRKCTVTGLQENPRDGTCDLQTRRKKRDTGGIVFDRYSDPTTAFYPTIGIKAAYIEHNERSKRRAPYTNVTARADCLQMMNTSVFQKCNKIPNFDVDGMINNCVLDAVVTNTMDWTIGHLESIKHSCIEYLEVMQPLPPDVRAQLVVLPDHDVTDEAYNYPALPPLTLPESGVDPFSADTLDDIKSESCPNECEGTCKCDEPYVSFDCSIDKTNPPVMLGIPDKGECDIQQRRCAETAVFGWNFAETQSLSCRLEHFVIDQSNTLQRGDSVDVEGSYESMFEVYCRLPESRRKRSVPDDADLEDEIAYGYFTSVSNDGQSFSDGDTIVIYDSQCVNCTKVQGDILCVKKSGYCLREGLCYSPGETSGCYTCTDRGGDVVEWSTASECKTVENSETKNVWIIGVIAGSCVAVVVASVAVVCYIGKRKAALRRKNTVSLSSLQR